jgi:hypothetical protein
MAEESPLEHPAEIYSRFDAAETRHLRTYVDDVKAFTNMVFFANPARSLRIEDRPSTVRLTEIDDEAVRAVTGLFRSLYVPTEPTSYRATFNLLKRHVYESPLRDAALHELRGFGPLSANVV